MKKILMIILSLLLCLGLAGCGSDDNAGGNAVDDIEDGAQEMEDDVKDDMDKIEMSVDSVAEKLGLTGGTETMYDTIGAAEGKQFNDGTVEIYRFDADSDEYKAIEEGSGTIKAAAVNDGMVIITDDEDLAAKFKELKFK